MNYESATCWTSRSDTAIHRQKTESKYKPNRKSNFDLKCRNNSPSSQHNQTIGSSINLDELTLDIPSLTTSADSVYNCSTELESSSKNSKSSCELLDVNYYFEHSNLNRILSPRPRSANKQSPILRSAYIQSPRPRSAKSSSSSPYFQGDKQLLTIDEISERSSNSNEIYRIHQQRNVEISRILYDQQMKTINCRPASRCGATLPLPVNRRINNKRKTYQCKILLPYHENNAYSSFQKDQLVNAVIVDVSSDKSLEDIRSICPYTELMSSRGVNKMPSFVSADSKKNRKSEMGCWSCWNFCRKRRN